MTEKADEIDTTNKFLVSANTSGEFAIYRLPVGLIPKQDALLLAAYIVSMACDDALWKRTLEAVQNT